MTASLWRSWIADATPDSIGLINADRRFRRKARKVARQSGHDRPQSLTKRLHKRASLLEAQSMS